jgi:alcohol dehydrogenase
MAVSMMNIPTRIYSGFGSLSVLQEECGNCGKKAFVVTTGDDMEKLGLLGKLTSHLDRRKVSSTVFTGITPNPKTSEIEEGAELFRKEGCDCIISLGGGSSIDAAKNISMIVANEGSIYDFLPGGNKVDMTVRSSVPHIAVPTTAGTGSEATKTAVVTNDQNNQKYGVRHNCIYPEVSLVDPELMMTVPKGVTADTGIDVFFHAMEAYFSNKATPFSDLVAVESMRLVIEFLPRVYEDTDDIEARSRMAWASTLGGIALDNAICVGIHGLGQPVGGYVDAIHGKSLCAVFNAYMKHTWQSDIPRYAVVAGLLGGDDGKYGAGELAEMSSELLADFLEGLDLNVRLKDLGVEEEMIPAIAQSVLNTTKRTLECCKMDIGYDDIVAIYTDSL